MRILKSKVVHKFCDAYTSLKNWNTKNTSLDSRYLIGEIW